MSDPDYFVALSIHTLDALAGVDVGPPSGVAPFPIYVVKSDSAIFSFNENLDHARFAFIGAGLNRATALGTGARKSSIVLDQIRSSASA